VDQHPVALLHRELTCVARSLGPRSAAADIRGDAHEFEYRFGLSVVHRAADTGDATDSTMSVLSGVSLSLIVRSADSASLL